MSIMSNAKRALAIAAAAATLLSMAACGSSNAASGKSDSSGAASSGKIEVVASINQWGSVAEDLGGSNVEVTNIMTKTNVEAHDYEPTSQDVAKFGTAQGSRSQRRRLRPVGHQGRPADQGHAGHRRRNRRHHGRRQPARLVLRQGAFQHRRRHHRRLPEGRPSHKDDYAKLNKEWHAKEDQLESKIKETSAKTEGLPYAATESVAWYLADDLKMTDATPKGYAQASANESEPTPADIKDFQDTLKAGFIKMFVFNSQEANSTTDQITGAAKDANVPIVELAEQMPKQYTNLLDWMSALVDQFAAAVK